MRKLTLTVLALLLCSSAIAKQRQPYFSEYPVMDFVCENSQVENHYVALKVNTAANVLSIYHDVTITDSAVNIYTDRDATSYHINSSSAEPDPHATDEFGVPLKKLPWDMVMVITNDRHVLMNKSLDAGVWYVQEHDNYYQCIPHEPYWRAYETFDPPK